ncbi:hypothetical protein [Flavobacterium longum]
MHTANNITPATTDKSDGALIKANALEKSQKYTSNNTGISASQ